MVKDKDRRSKNRKTEETSTDHASTATRSHSRGNSNNRTNTNNRTSSGQCGQTKHKEQNVNSSEGGSSRGRRHYNNKWKGGQGQNVRESQSPHGRNLNQSSNATPRRYRHHRGRWKNSQTAEPSQASTSTASSSSADNDVEIPGFYYDREKKKYFKILPGHNNAPGSVVTRDSVKQKKAEETRQKDVADFSVNIGKELFAPSHVKLKPSNIVSRLYDRTAGLTSVSSFRTQVKESCIKGLQLRGRRQIYGSQPISRERVDHMQHMWPNSSGEYLACMWALQSSFCQLVQPIKIQNMVGVAQDRSVTFDVKPVGSAANHAFSRISDMCWAPRHVGERETEYLLYTTTCYTGMAPSLVKMRNMLPDSERDLQQSHEFNIGQRVTWACAWSAEQSKVAIGTERCSLVMDMARRLWELYTARSDALSQEFDKGGRLLYSGTRSGTIFAHDLRSVSTRSVAAFGAKSPVCHLKQTKDQNYLVAADFSGKIRNWDLRTNKVVLSYAGNKNEYSKIPCHISEEDDLVYSAGCDNYVRLWSLSTGKLLHTIPPAYPASIDTIPTVYYSNSLTGNYPGLLIGTRDVILMYSM